MSRYGQVRRPSIDFPVLDARDPSLHRIDLTDIRGLALELTIPSHAFLNQLSVSTDSIQPGSKNGYSFQTQCDLSLTATSGDLCTQEGNASQRSLSWDIYARQLSFQCVLLALLFAMSA